MSDNNTPVLVRRFYPTLSSVVTQDEIPDALGFIKDGIVFLFDKIHFKDLQYSKSPRGDAAFYSLSIVTKDRLDIEIPATGVFLVLNPDLGVENPDATISSFPITIEYEWKVLAYLRSFNLDQFDFSPKAFFETALRVLSISEEQAIANFINTFTESADENTTSLQQFVDDLNGFNTSANIDSPDENTNLTDVVKDIYAKTSDYATMMAFGTYILNNDVEETKVKLNVYFQALLPQDIEEYIKDILIPKFRATLLLRAAVEFPRSILQPVYPEGHANALEVIPEGTVGFFDKVLLSFGEALFFADTEKGFGYNMDIILNTVTPAMIGNTGLVIDIHNLKIDLSRDENIIEADLDGRPPEFMGIYTERTDIFLPKKWFKKDTGQTLAITGQQLLIGTGGISGTVSLRATYAQDADGVIENYFEDYFSLIYDGAQPLIVISNGTEEVIDNHTELVSHINGLINPNTGLVNPYQLRFKFPLELTANTTGTTLRFENEVDYNNFISAIDPNQFMWFQLGSDDTKAWRIGFDQFNISFHHGEVLQSNLHAQLEIPKFENADNPGQKAIIDLNGEWLSNEDFRLSATFLPDTLDLNLFDLLTVKFQTAELGKEEGVFYLEADTKFSFPDDSLAYSIFGGQEIDLPAIRFYFDGRFEMVGQSSIPTNLSLPIGPVEMSVTAIHLGSIQREFQGRMRKYNYIGFDGGISINPLGLDVRGDGVKYYYTVDNDELDEDENNLPSDSYFHISTLEVDLIIPGSSEPSDAIAIIKGSLTIPEPGVSTEYRGKISVQLPQANIYGEASMRLDPSYPAYLIDASVEFPVPIPLGPLGVFGFRGLLGYRYVAEKEAIGMTEEDYWYDYYMAPDRGINYEKFSGPEQTGDYTDPFSVGIGASIATMDGGGRTASLRAMMLLSLPSMFAIDAGLTILSSRLGMAEDDPSNPPFYAFVIIGDDSLEFGAGADYQLNKSNGWFMDIQAQIQAGFFFKNQHPWYINFGTRQNPITATLFKDVLSLRAQSFLMIAASGIEAGARVDFEMDLFIAKLWASIEVGGYISFERPQIGGYMIAEGGLHIDFWIFDITASIYIIFRVELIKPFLILAELRIRVCARIKLPFGIRISVCVPLKFVLKWQKNNEVDRKPIAPLTAPGIPGLPNNNPDYPKEINTESYVKGVHMLTHEVFALNFLGVEYQNNDANNFEPDPIEIDAVIPLDTFVDIKVEKGLIPSGISNKIGGHTGGASNYKDLIPPKKNQPGGHELRQVKHKYSIESIEIFAHDGTSWHEYHPYKAILPSDDSVDNLKIGYWQRNGDQYDTIRLLATNPFSFLDGAEPGWFIPEQYGITPSELFCTVTNENEDCANFLNKSLGLKYYPPSAFVAHYINGAYFTIQGETELTPEGETIGDHAIISNDTNAFGYAKSFTFQNINPLIIILPEAAVRVKLKLSTHSESVTLNYYRGVTSDSIYQSYELVSTVELDVSQLNTEIVYDNTDDYNPLESVTKIEIIPNGPDIQNIIDIRLEMEELLANAYDTAEGITASVLSGDDLALYNSLNAQLETLKAQGCSNIERECNKDLKICGLLDNHLLDAFKDYFPKDIESISEIRDFISKYLEFTEQISSTIDESVISQSLQPEFNDYNANLNSIIENEGNDEVIPRYYLMREAAQELINKLTILGDCDCDDKPCKRDEVVCVLYNNLLNLYNTCFPEDADELKDIQKHFDCYQNFDQAIITFYENYPNYDLFDYLGDVYISFKNLLQVITNWSAGNEFVLQTYLDFLGATNTIIQMISDLGDCNCIDGIPTTRICTTSLQEVCWLTREQYELNLTIPSQTEVAEDTQIMIAGIQKTVQPVWRPNTKYYIKFRLKDEVDNGESLSGFFDYYYGFRTVGPLGHFHKHPEVNYFPDDFDANNNSVNEYPITSLNKYIDYKRSYPNANGNLLQSKPLFYGNKQCKISIYFAEQFVYHMLNTWEEYILDAGTNAKLPRIEGAMHIMIKDPISDVIIPYPLPEDWEVNETVPETVGDGENGLSWIGDDDPNIPHNIQILNNFINHVNENPNGMECHIELGNPISPASYAYSITLSNLKPQKLYTALVFNAFDANEDGKIKDHVDDNEKIIYEENQKIHEYVFQTSRYKNFREQVDSYMLKELDAEGNVINQMPAVFEHEIELSPEQITNVFDLFDSDSANSNSELQTIAQQFQDRFDRAVEGVLNLKAFDPPTTTDFIKIRNSATNNAIALLVRNPEPFNNPKITLEEIGDTIKIMDDSDSPSEEYHVLHSKDYSQALIMHDSKVINETSLNIQFRYKTWDGQNYDVEPEPDTPLEEKLHTVYLENLDLNL